MKKENSRLPLKLIASACVSVIALIFFSITVTQALKKSDYFKIREIVYKESGPLNLSHLAGRSIFSLNLKEEAETAIKIYPMYKKITLVRVMPNRIFADALKRKPLAYIKLDKYFYIDDEAVIFQMPEQQEILRLPQIFGLDKKISGALPGKKYNIKELNLALEIIKETARNPKLKDYNIKKIDLIGPGNISFFVNFIREEGAVPKILEIRAGFDNIEEKINVLGALFAQIKEDYKRIKYVDLRFKEPLIKFSDVK